MCRGVAHVPDKQHNKHRQHPAAAPSAAMKSLCCKLSGIAAKHKPKHPKQPQAQHTGTCSAYLITRTQTGKNDEVWRHCHTSELSGPLISTHCTPMYVPLVALLHSHHTAQSKDIMLLQSIKKHAGKCISDVAVTIPKHGSGSAAVPATPGIKPCPVSTTACFITCQHDPAAP